MRPQQARTLGEELERRVAGELRRRAQKRRDGFLDLRRRRVARSAGRRNGSLQVGVHRLVGYRGSRARAAGQETLVLEIGGLAPELLVERKIAQRGGHVDLVPEVVQHVHDRHAGDGVRRVRGELVARDAAHVQVGQPAFERVADLDACRCEPRIEDDQQAARRCTGADPPPLEDLVGLRFDRRLRVARRDDVDVDPEIVVEKIGHPAEPCPEGREDAHLIVNPCVLHLGGAGRRLVRAAILRGGIRRDPDAGTLVVTTLDGAHPDGGTGDHNQQQEQERASTQEPPLRA